MKECRVRLIERHEKVVAHKIYAETEAEAILKAGLNQSHTRTEGDIISREVDSIVSVRETGKEWKS